MAAPLSFRPHSAGSAARTAFPASLPSPAPEGSRPGEFSWHELAATDYEAAFGFYSELLGWERTDAMDMGEDGIYQMYGCGRDGSTTSRWMTFAGRRSG